MLMATMAIVAVAAACAPPPPAPELPPTPADQGLRVMTYNLLGAMADSAVYSEHAGWAARIDQLVPDVVVLQEAQYDDVQAVRQLTGTDYEIARYLRWDCDVKPEREGVAILVRSELQILGSGATHVGSTCVDPTVRRVLVWADVEVDDAPLRIYGTHLTAGGAASAESRDAQIRRIKEIIAEHDVTDSRRWLLVGDMNFHPGSRSYRLMTGQLPEEPGPYPLLDTYAEASPDADDPAECPPYAADDAEGMAHLLEHPDHVRRCGYTGGWPRDDDWLACGLLSLCTAWEDRRDTSVRVRIDYVLRAGGGPLEVLDAFVPNRTDDDWAVPGAEWYRLSDHLPYVVDLAVGVPPDPTRT